MQARAGATSVPQIPDNLPPGTIAGGDLDDASWVEVAIDGAHLTAVRGRGVTIDSGRLTRVNLADTELQALRGNDVEFAHCNLSNTILLDASLERTVLVENKMTGCQVRAARLRHVEFRECRMDLVSFESVRLRAVTFRSCVLREARFSDCAFDHVLFEDCDLTGAAFERSGVQESEMFGCRLEGVRGFSELRGIAMRWSDVLDNAGAFAAELGIRIFEAGAMESPD